ncbi:MAG TPA: hypothetical protein VMW47_04055 [Verrucomicrobiae bacterium]|nr:hypothetical protein [Verrucomicrobiae bacterium]
MSILDRAKQQASELRGRAEDKVQDLADKRRADDLLAQLGRLTYAERTERGGPDDAAAVERLVADLKGLEANGTAILAVR